MEKEQLTVNKAVQMLYAVEDYLSDCENHFVKDYESTCGTLTSATQRVPVFEALIVAQAELNNCIGWINEAYEKLVKFDEGRGRRARMLDVLRQRELFKDELVKKIRKAGDVIGDDPASWSIADFRRFVKQAKIESARALQAKERIDDEEGKAIMDDLSATYLSIIEQLIGCNHEIGE